MNLLFLNSTPSHSLHISTFSCSYRAPKISTPISPTTIPARDRLIDFGKYKGKMLGTLPSNYLKWVSKNLRARDFEDWAKLADEVLDDPIYKDRIEWEFAQKILNGDVSSLPLSKTNQTAVSELLESSERFGWNNDDKVGWSKIDFGLLGTSKGGRIPRVSDKGGGGGREIELKREKVGGCGEEKRRERRERVRLKKSSGLQLQELPMGKRMMMLGNEDKCTDSFKDNDDGDDDNEKVEFDGNRKIKQESAAEIRSPFPGRETLWKKVLSRRRK